MFNLKGDSGGAFHVKLGLAHFVVGIISSAAHRECNLNEFVLFTNVPKFISWINTEINLNNDNDEWFLEPLKCTFYYNSDDK